MSKGFDVDFDMPSEEVEQLIKEYKKIKKYQKSNFFAIKTMDGTEKVVSTMIEEAREGGF